MQRIRFTLTYIDEVYVDDDYNTEDEESIYELISDVSGYDLGRFNDVEYEVEIE